MATTSDAEARGETQQFLLLESLNTDVLVLILSATDSFDDLSALIRSSPTLYGAFLTARSSILVAVGLGHLGPVLPDAIMLAHTVTTWKPRTDYNEPRHVAGQRQRGVRPLAWGERFSSVMDAYRQWLESTPETGRMLPGTTTVDAAICVGRLVRSVQFFVDLYARTRIDYFRSRGLAALVPKCTSDLAAAERRSLERAFIRLQIIFNLYFSPGGIEPVQKEFFYNRMFALFSVWEKEQLSEADEFLRQVVIALRCCEKMDDGIPLTPERENAIIRKRQATAWGSTHLPRGGAVTVIPHPRESYFETFYNDLSALRRKILETAAADPSFMDRMLSFPSLQPEPKHQGGSASHAFLHSSHSSRLGSLLLDRPPGDVDSPPASRLECPNAWKQAMGASRELGWGANLMPQSKPDGMDQEEWRNLQSKVRLWRWSGFMFFSKERAEALKAAGLLGPEGVDTGWLGRWNSEVRAQLLRSLPRWPDGRQSVQADHLLNW
jgi:hypothetical protein